jgi:hypothetical protein
MAQLSIHEFQNGTDGVDAIVAAMLPVTHAGPVIIADRLPDTLRPSPSCAFDSEAMLQSGRSTLAASPREVSFIRGSSRAAGPQASVHFQAALAASAEPGPVQGPQQPVGSESSGSVSGASASHEPVAASNRHQQQPARAATKDSAEHLQSTTRQETVCSLGSSDITTSLDLGQGEHSQDAGASDLASQASLEPVHACLTRLASLTEGLKRMHAVGAGSGPEEQASSGLGPEDPGWAAHIHWTDHSCASATPSALQGERQWAEMLTQLQSSRGHIVANGHELTSSLREELTEDEAEGEAGHAALHLSGAGKHGALTEDLMQQFSELEKLMQSNPGARDCSFNAATPGAMMCHLMTSMLAVCQHIPGLPCAV